MINNKRSYTEYNITSPTTDFAIGFENYGVGAKDIIEVTLNGVLVESLGYTVRLKNAQVLEVTPAIEAGTVRLQRVTGIDSPFHKFTAGALFTAKSMDENFEQIRHSQQEVNDGFIVSSNKVNSTLNDYSARITDVETDVSTFNAKIDNHRTVLDAKINSSTSTLNTKIDNSATTLNSKIIDESQARIQGDLANRRYTEDLIGMGQIWDGISSRAVYDYPNAKSQEAVNQDLKDKIDITNTGYRFIDSFGLGATITQRNQALRHAADGKLYRWAGDLPKVVPASSTPTSSGGISANAWLEVSDTALRNDVTFKGVGSVSELLDILSPYNGMRVYVKSYHAGLGKGGGFFIYDSSKSALNDGGTVINGWVRDIKDTVSLYDFGAIPNTDVATHLIRFTDYLKSNAKVRGVVQGVFDITAPVTLEWQSLRVYLDVDLTTINTSEIGIELKCSSGFIDGSLRLTCGSTDMNINAYNSRRQDIGLKISSGNSGKIDSLYVIGAKRYGVLIGEGSNNNHLMVSKITVNSAGTIENYINNTVLTVVNSGEYTELSKKSTLTFDSPLNPLIQAEDYLWYNSKPYLIMERNGDTLKVFPHIESSVINKSVTFLIGAGVYIVGADSNICNFGNIDITSAGVALKAGGFYGSYIDMLHTAVGSIALCISSKTQITSANLGGAIGYLYTETFPIDILLSTAASKMWSILSALDYVKGVSLDSYTIPYVVSDENTSREGIVKAASATFYTQYPNYKTVAPYGILAGNLRTNSPLGYTLLMPTSKIISDSTAIDVHQKGYADVSRQFNLSGRFTFATNSKWESTRNAAVIDISIFKGTTYEPIVLLEQQGSVLIKLVTLTFEGIEYYALDLTALGFWDVTPAFVGYYPSDVPNNLRTIVATAASNVVPYTDINANAYRTGATTARPTSIAVGHTFFDTTLSKPVYWTGSAWVDSAGADA